VRYSNLKPIGRGAYGLVASADDALTGRRVAIKRISRVFQDLIDAKRILREMKLLRHLGRHENLVELVSLEEPPGGISLFSDVYICTKLWETDLHRVLYSKQVLSQQHVQYFV
jgi:mitogen-activated protein kinase 1/3